MQQNLYWLVPVGLGALLLLLGWLRFRPFFWRIALCVVPMILAGIVTMQAAVNFENPDAKGYRFNLGVDLAGGTILVYQGDKTWWESLSKGEQDTFDSAKLAEILKRRIDPANLMEITIRPVKSSPPRVEIIVPVRPGQGGQDIERVKNVVQQVGKLEFRILADTRDENGAAVMEDAKNAVQGFVPDEKNIPPSPDASTLAWVELSPSAVVEHGFNAESPEGFQQLGTTAYYHAPKVKLPDVSAEKQFGRHFVLTRIPTADAMVTGEDLSAASPDLDPQTMRPIVRFSLKGPGAEKFWILTEPVQHYMAIILDGKMTSAPVLQSRLRDGGQITMSTRDPGSVQQKKVDELVLILRSGALPATLDTRPVSELTMGPTLGRDTIEKGSRALVIAFLAVVFFMCLYYHVAGGIASVALFANLLLTVGFMVAVNAAFTLPGLAGLVLMLGMAVDANVLIYERFREERDRGAGLALAIRNGYDRALPTILDTHLTSIFTAIVLYAVGNDQLKGFGVSLTVGLLISLFTSLFMTHVIFDILLSNNWLLRLTMFKILTRPNINFMRVRHYWFTATVLLSLFGVAIFALRGKAGLNIDFVGGTAYSVEFKDPQSIEDVREAISKSGLPDPAVDAIYPLDSTTGRLTRDFTFRTTLQNRDQVRDTVARTFGDQLVWTEVSVSKVEPLMGSATFDRKLDVSFLNAKPSVDEIRRVVENWLKDNGVALPERYFDVQAVADPGRGEQAPEKVDVKFAAPVGANVEELPELLTRTLHQPKSERLENFDSTLANEIQGKALAAIGLSWLAITLYLWFRFGNWTFGLAAVLCLIHDLMFTIGLIGLSHYIVVYTPFGGFLGLEDFKLDLPAVAALLTLVGFSVNDTIVVFDRIREVRGKSPELTPQMINDSINQTLSRTLLTSFITWLVVLVLYVGGGEGVHLFSFVMVVGVIIGTYSSIFVASPLLLIFGEGRPSPVARGRQQPQVASVP